MKYIVVALALALASCERRTCVRTKEQEVWMVGPVPAGSYQADRLYAVGARS